MSQMAPVPYDTTSDPLLRPFRLKHLTLKNRIMSTSHACGLVEDGMPSERRSTCTTSASSSISNSFRGASTPTAPH